MAEMIGVYCTSYPAPPAAVTLDIDDSCDVVHGYQQLSFWSATLFLEWPPPRALLPAGPRVRYRHWPSGGYAAAHRKDVFGRRSGGPHSARDPYIRHHRPDTHITIQADGHHGRPEAMTWCEGHGVDYVRGLPPKAVRRADPEIVRIADSCAVRRAKAQHPVLCEKLGLPATRRCSHQASTLGMAIRYGVTSLAAGSAEHIYDMLYCAHGQTENLIKLHK